MDIRRIFVIGLVGLDIGGFMGMAELYHGSPTQPHPAWSHRLPGLSGFAPLAQGFSTNSS